MLDRLTTEENPDEMFDEIDKENQDNIEGTKKDIQKVLISQINMSLSMYGQEIMVFGMHGIKVEQIVSEIDTIQYIQINRIQIDNNYGEDPLFPTFLKPICTFNLDQRNVKKKLKHDHVTMLNVPPILEFYLHELNNIPNVRFIKLLEFVWREF